MKNIIKTVFLTLIYLFSFEGMGMEHELGVGSIKAMQEGLTFRNLDIQYGAIPKESDYKSSEPLEKNVLTVEKSRGDGLMTIWPVPAEICQKIWDYLNCNDKFNLCFVTKTLYNTIGESSTFDFFRFILKETLSQSNNQYKDKFIKLFMCTKKMDLLSNKAKFPEIQNKAAILITTNEHIASSFLEIFKRNVGDLSTSLHENKYIYLCSIYNKMYVPKSCCEKLGSSCSEFWSPCLKCCSDTQSLCCYATKDCCACVKPCCSCLGNYCPECFKCFVCCGITSGGIITVVRLIMLCSGVPW